MFCYKAKPFAKELKWFFSLTPWHKFVVICTVSFFTLWGGSKERGILPPGLIDDISSTMTRVVETIQLRTLPENIASNAFAVTDFAVDSQEKETAFGVGWASNLFENVDSRNVDLFMSTNLAVTGWFPLGRYLMPQGTNAYAFTISSNDVALAYRPIYVDSFSRMAFFRFGLDFDSDGDGLTDSYESFVSFTDSSNPDTDGDGLSDAQELAAGIGTNPLLYDTDGDGVGDGDEIAVGSNPHSADTDGDGLLDVAELGSMTALTQENFMWFDMSDGTDLLASSSTADENTWTIGLPQNVMINNVCHTNALVCMNGIVHLLCPTNSGGTHYSGSNYSGGLSNTQWSAMHVTVALFNADLYARPAEWGSKVLYGSVESGGRTFGVVEYRNVGLYSLRNAESNELLTCQIVIPDDETNTVYVSYLCASNTFREIAVAAGVQCGRMRSWKSGETCYNLSWPLTSEFPEDGLTIKYSIGTGTDPCDPDTDDDGLSDAEEALGCRTDPLVEDSDGDLLLDAEEIAIGTDPMAADSDGDGMPDGWEVLNSLDPLADDAAGDPDGDGLANLREYALGTSPVSVDTDGDGLTDRAEVGWWEYADSMPVFDVSGGTNLLQVSRAYYSDTFKVPLPFIVRSAGYVHTNMTVGVCGMIGLMSDRKSDYSFLVSSSNYDLSDYRVSYYHTAVAAYWDYLCSPANSGVQITVADVDTNGLRYAVVEYSNIRLYSQRNDASCVATFQIVIPEAETNTVYVHYIDLPDAFDGSSATTGAQLPNREQTHLVSFDTAGAVTNGMVVAYHLGTGSNPTVADTDGDGLDDGTEATIGTSARYADTDLDGLTDVWENANGLDPLSATDGNGADGDPDGDHLSNEKEFEYGTDPSVADTDGDGLRDGLETGSVFATNAIPWLSFDVSEDLTTEISTNYRRCVSRSIPVPLRIQGETVTNLTISANGIVFLNRAGHSNPGNSTSSSDFKYRIDDNALVLAPYLQYAYIRSDMADRQTSIKYGTATCGGVGYLLVEYLNSFYNTSTWQTNSISFQLAIPTNAPDRAYFRCCDVTGQYMDGRYASIGMQTFDGRWLHSWCYRAGGKVENGLALEFLFGANSDPLSADSDADGLTDKQEVDSGFDPLAPDMDKDGMPDGWEVSHGLNPRNAAGDDGAHGDPDHDGLSNIDEYLNNSDPHSADTDGDGVSDCIEVEREADPTDPSDDGEVPPPELFRTLTFNIYGDWAAWEMQIEGLGPEDTRIRRISMGAPDASETSTMKMRKGNSYRVSMRWLNCGNHDDNMSPWYCWQALIDGLPGQKSFDDNYSEGYCVRISQRNNIVVGNGWIADNEDGLLTSHVHASSRNSHGGPGAGNVAQGLYATLYVLGDPKVIPDYDRDGEIDSSDEAIYDEGQTTLRFWVNDDNDSGNVNDSKNDRPGSGSNGQDGTVNGRGDLLDFTPVLLDVSGVFPPGTPNSIKERISWKLESSVVNAVWTSLSPSGAGSFHKTDCGATFGPNLSQNAHEAAVTSLGGGAALPDGFVSLMDGNGGKGVVMIEGRASGKDLKLKGYIDGSTTAASEGSLDIEISSVEDMYRWLCMRYVCGDSSGLGSRLGVPPNRPDAECDGRHFVFVHGYNVDVQSARGWASEMFKRLWQSGSQSMFTAVDWFGNDSQIWEGVPVVGGEALDYYINVRHALDTALNFSVAANALPGSKVMLAHSLGNMLVSEAAKFHLLDYQKYYMLNAAVPVEAYDDGATAQEMIEHGWRDVDPSKWAANWSERIPYSGDPRQTLKWRGRFAGIHDAINCYSPTEDILENASMNGWGGLWGAQELFKGTATLHFIPGNCEGGWGYNGEHTNIAGLLTDFAKTNDFTDAELIASPIFRKFDNPLLHQTNLIAIAQTELNKVMGDGIPARSFAAGRNPIGSSCVSGNVILSPKNLTDWPNERKEHGQLKWWHSDICQIAFFYVHHIFMKIKSGDTQ